MCEFHVLKNLVNQMRFLKIDLTVGEGLNVDASVVVEVPLIFNVKLGSYLYNRLFDCCGYWGGKDAVVIVYNKDEFT